MRKIRASKKETMSQEQFREGFGNLIRRMGAVPAMGMYDWTIQTEAGPLLLACGRFDPPGSRTIFGREGCPGGVGQSPLGQMESSLLRPGQPGVP
jgi:hypothetical protein